MRENEDQYNSEQGHFLLSVVDLILDFADDLALKAIKSTQLRTD